MNTFKSITGKLASLLLMAGLFIFSTSYAATSANIISQAQNELNAGHTQDAYNLLKKHELEFAGDTEYDTLLGQAALAANQPTMAVFAFERCLIIQPNNQNCQLGMAKAHIELKEVESAQQIIANSQLDRQSGQYQDLLADFRRILLGETDTDTRFNLWLQTGVGYDSNANTATIRDSIFLPDYGSLILDRDSQRKESFFNQTMLGLNYSTAINDKWRFLAGSLVRHKNNWRVHDYDDFITDARIGMQRNHNGHRLTLRALGQYYNLGGHSYRNTVGAIGQYSYSFNETTDLGGFVQYSHMHYPHASHRDSNRATAGLTWSHQIEQGKAILYGSFYGGRDAADDSDYSHLSYDLGGLQLGSTWLVTPRTRLDLNVSYLHRRYDKQEPLFKKQRRDNQIGARLGMVYAINRQFSLRPSYEYIHTNSSVPVRDYSRHIVSFNIRYAFF